MLLLGDSSAAASKLSWLPAFQNSSAAAWLLQQCRLSTQSHTVQQQCIIIKMRCKELGRMLQNGAHCTRSAGAAPKYQYARIISDMQYTVYLNACVHSV